CAVSPVELTERSSALVSARAGGRRGPCPGTPACRESVPATCRDRPDQIMTCELAGEGRPRLHDLRRWWRRPGRGVGAQRVSATSAGTGATLPHPPPAPPGTA